MYILLVVATKQESHLGDTYVRHWEDNVEQDDYVDDVDVDVVGA